MGMLSEHADLVLVDSPPLLPVTDPAIIAAHVDGVIVVVAEGSTTRRQLRHAVSTLRQVDAKPVGIVLNNSESDAMTSYGYYHQHGVGQGPRASWRAFRRKSETLRPSEGGQESSRGQGRRRARREPELVTTATAGVTDRGKQRRGRPRDE
jgi:Mrp family chromosome partitioning ATPase